MWTWCGSESLLPLCLRFDVALLKLSSDATLNSYVQLGSLPPAGQILPHNNLCYITGWGRTSSKLIVSEFPLYAFGVRTFQWISMYLASPRTAGGPLSPQLKQAYLPLVDHKTCSSSDWWGSTVKTTMVCGGGGAESGCNVSLKDYRLFFWTTTKFMCQWS